MKKALLLFVVALSLVTGKVCAQVHDPRAINADPATATAPIAPVLEGLGNQSMDVTTTSERSQYFFNQGLRLTLGFNHSEALRSFKEAVRLDPNNAMAYWGWALVLGPNLNLPMQPAVVPEAYRAISAAVALKEQVSARERTFIDALAVRYTDDPDAPRAPLDRVYAEAMAAVVEQYPNDAHAWTLYAAALMNTNPWDYWYRDGSPKPSTVTILAALDRALELDPDHAGAHHYRIHAVEAFRPELGIESADKLAALMPGAGHLVHMPSHIYMRVGRYADSYATNVKAIAADEGYITQCRAQGMYPLVYYPHNVHFLSWSAMFQGRSDEAITAARKVATSVGVISRDNIWGLYESFGSQPLYVLARFGKWEEILAEGVPGEGSIFMNGVWHYARGLAYLHTGKRDAAEDELARLTALREHVEKDADYRVGFGAAGTLLKVAEEILRGDIIAKKGDFHTALAHIERAVRLEDSLLYNEPPDWYFPVRHVLGAILLDAGRPAEAEVVYWNELKRYPHNGFSLFGLEQALAAQGKDELARVIHGRFEDAWSQADVKLTSSRF